MTLVELYGNGFGVKVVVDLPTDSLSSVRPLTYPASPPLPPCWLRCLAQLAAVMAVMPIPFSVKQPCRFTAGIDTSSKATLYNNPEIRVRIESLRQQQAQVPTPKQIKQEMDENNKDAIIASLKRKMKKLEEENKKLREQLKFSYAEVYQKI
ncbi:DUF6262 family protein [Paenibacillus filicis]|uniref:DUF6262 family protein n=1 Tax=Paenibacillus filicis TaxID=669464 RepID=A0ABU9DG81_9BACL